MRAPQDVVNLEDLPELDLLRIAANVLQLVHKKRGSTPDDSNELQNLRKEVCELAAAMQQQAYDERLQLLAHAAYKVINVYVAIQYMCYFKCICVQESESE